MIVSMPSALQESVTVNELLISAKLLPESGREYPMDVKAVPLNDAVSIAGCTPEALVWTTILAVAVLLFITSELFQGQLALVPLSDAL